MSKKKRATAPHAQVAGGAFAAIPHNVIDSAAWQDLSCHARVLLIELVRRFNGHNNGQIALDSRTARERLGSSYRKVTEAFDDLQTHGFIELTEESIWQERLAREYRLTWALSGRSPPYRRPSFAYRTWSTETPVMRIDRRKKAATDAVAETPKTATASVASPTRTATASVAADKAEPPKTANPEAGFCYRTGSAYNYTIGGRRRLAPKAKATAPYGAATNDAAKLAPAAETASAPVSPMKPDNADATLPRRCASAAADRERWQGDPAFVLDRVLAGGGREAERLAEMPHAAAIASIETMQRLLRIAPGKGP